MPHLIVKSGSSHRPVDSYRKASPHPVAPKKSLEDPRITRKGDPDPKICPFSLKGQPLHPLTHAFQIFTEASREGWGAPLGDLMARGTWSLTVSKLHINYVELKAVSLALKEFQDVCSNIAADNTTLVACLNKERGMRLGPVCALLWSMLI